MKRLINLLLRGLVRFYYRIVAPRLKAIVSEYHTSEVRVKANSFGDHSRINGVIQVIYPDGLVVGNNVHIGANCYFYCQGGLYIGDNTHLSRNISIYTANHDYEGVRIPYDDSNRIKPVFIEENVWIGMNVCITPGIRIGEGAIIGMGSVVTKDVQKFAVIGNPPYRLIKERDQELYKKLKTEKKFGGVNGTELRGESSKIRINQVENITFCVSTESVRRQHALVKMMQAKETVTVKSQSIKFLPKYAFDYLNGDLKDEDVNYALRIAFSFIHFNEITKGYIEVDRYLVPFIPHLAGLFPQSNFLWLMGDQDIGVSSLVKEALYSRANESNTLSKKYALNLGELAGISNWDTMDEFQKTTRFYDFWNEMISKELNLIDQKRWKKLDIDEVRKGEPIAF